SRNIARKLAGLVAVGLFGLALDLRLAQAIAPRHVGDPVGPLALSFEPCGIPERPAFAPRRHPLVLRRLRPGLPGAGNGTNLVERAGESGKRLTCLPFRAR